MNSHIASLKLKWQDFKNARDENPKLSYKHNRFMTMLERESLIDVLFKQLENV